jgi:hypothetical protein
MLIRIRKPHADHMSDLPLQDSLTDLQQPYQS